MPAPQHPTRVALALVLAASALGWAQAAPATREPPPPPSAAVAAPALGVLDLYADNRAQGIPNHVTADLVLLGYSLVRRAAIADLEDQALRPAFGGLIAAMAGRLGPGKDPVTLANRRYLTLLQALFAGDPEGLDATPAAEYALVTQAAGISPSGLWGRPLDYSQFAPRGRYSADPALGHYFRALRYAGALPLLVVPSPATGTSPEAAGRMAAQALQLARLIAADPDLAAQRRRIDDLLAWQFGPAEDLTDADVLAVAGDAKDRNDLARRLLDQARANRRQPRIIDGLVDKALLESGQTAAEVMTGWRLLPSRYNPEAAAFQRLVFDGTGGFEGAPDAKPFGLGVVAGRPVKAYPSATEILALLGSKGAADELTAAGETAFAGYTQASRDAAALLGAAEGLAAAHLLTLRQGIRDQDSPERRTALRAFWTWQRYLEVLYAKQSYTLMGKGMALERPRPGATLEPATGLYLALGRLAGLSRQRTDDPRWQTLADLFHRLADISFRQDQGTPLVPEDERFLNRLDLDLLALAGTGDAPIVVDVHTHAAESMVVEEAVGWAAPVQQGPARGARLTHYEFKQPLAERLTDAAWRERIPLPAGPTP